MFRDASSSGRSFVLSFGAKKGGTDGTVYLGR